MSASTIFSEDFSFLNGPHGKIATVAVNFHPGNKARLILAHGFSASASMVEHAKLFTELALKAASELDIGVLMFDFTGNGLSDGYFNEMTPNGRIHEASFLIDHLASAYDGPIFLLGLSMGGAVSVHTASRRAERLSGLITWSCVPSFDPSVPSAHWYPAVANPAHCESPGPAFYTDRPERSIADVYTSLSLPKLQIQGDEDFAFFAEEFKPFFEQAQEPKKLILLKGGDHVFTSREVRTRVLTETIAWLKERLA